MKITVDKSSFLDGLIRCAGVANLKSPMPALANVYIEANKASPTGLFVAATDIMRAIVVDVDGVKVDAEGTICLQAREIVERIKQLPPGRVAFSVEASKATMKTVGTTRRFTMTGIPGHEFPSIPTVEGHDAVLEIKSEKLLQLINSVHFSISTDTSRPVYAAMLLEFDKHGQRVVSTDGHRITTLRAGCEPNENRWVIPLEAVTDLRKLLSNAESEDAVLTQDQHTLFVKLDNFVYSTKLVDAQYMPWQHAVPQIYEKTVTVERGVLIESLRAVSVSSSVLNGAVKFTFKKGALTLEAVSATNGEGFDELQTDDTGDTSEVTMTASYVLDALQAIASEQVTISSSGPRSAPVIRPVGSEDFMALILPIVP